MYCVQHIIKLAFFIRHSRTVVQQRADNHFLSILFSIPVAEGGPSCARAGARDSNPKHGSGFPTIEPTSIILLITCYSILSVESLFLTDFQDYSFLVKIHAIQLCKENLLGT